MLDDNGKVVGRGCRAIAALWDGHQTIGCITADNLLHRKPITERQFELLTLYTSSLGHLFSRKRAEEALRESEERLEAFMDSATDAFFLLDPELDFADVNKTATERFDLSKEEIVGKNILDILPGLREAGRYDKYQEVLETGKPFSTDGLALRQRHGEVYLNIRAFKVGDGLGIISTDITERKQAQEKLEMQRQEQQTILDSVPALIFYKDMENRLIRVNNALLESFGMSKEEVEGKSLFDLFPNQADDYWRDDKEVMASGRSKRNIIESVETAQGTRWYQTDKIPYMDDAGNIVGIIGFSLDVTERKKAEESLEEQARQTRVLLDSMPCVAMLLRPGTREVVASNQAAVQMGAVSGKACYETFGQREDPCPWCLAPEVWATGEPQHLEVEALDVVWDANWVAIAPNLYLH
ncbi:MAG: PAS domain-containing protein, partial [Planctomycetia bacterium]|nr:PAS domain-containing protein [Planctomycetia bacterium]